MRPRKNSENIYESPGDKEGFNNNMPENMSPGIEGL